MEEKHKRLWRGVLGLCLAALLSGPAAAAEESADPDLPGKLPANSYDSLFSSSPFRRLLTLSDALVVTGIAKLPEGPVATILNRSNNQTVTVGREPNALGWRIVSVDGSRMETVQVRIEAEGQEVTVRFDPLQIAPEEIRRQRRRRAEPGRPAEEWKREPWVEQLDPDLITILDLLPRIRQTEFRATFADFLSDNPDAGSERLNSFARETIAQIRAAPEGLD
ncbi:MAG TPA: hypothetical protein VMN36_07600 [Verrucomicrobiales bacterium]|nr:hypothetical protein [Verrucomicrobiales bacterium]